MATACCHPARRRHAGSSRINAQRTEVSDQSYRKLIRKGKDGGRYSRDSDSAAERRRKQSVQTIPRFGGNAVQLRLNGFFYRAGPVQLDSIDDLMRGMAKRNAVVPGHCIQVQPRLAKPLQVSNKSVIVSPRRPSSPCRRVVAVSGIFTLAISGREGR